MTSLTLFLRPSTKSGHNAGSLSVRIVHLRRSKTLTLSGCKLYEEEWDKLGQKIIYPQDNPARFSCLEKIEQTIEKELEVISYYIDFLEKQGRYSVDDIIKLYHTNSNDSNLLGFSEALALEKERWGCIRTARAYRTVVRGLIRFNNGKDIPLVEVNSRLIKDFELSLIRLGKMPNTVSYYMRNLRAIYNRAVLEKKIIKRYAENHFSGVSTGVYKTTKRALSLNDIKALHEIDFGSLLRKESFGSESYKHLNSLYICQRLFFFCFFSRGMCFVDLVHLKRENIRGGIIRYRRKKTGTYIEIRITPAMQGIIDSFSREVEGSSYIFPILRDNGQDKRLQYESALHTQNERLKRLALLAGLNKPISTHVARHSWATVAKQQNIPLSVISECLGHSCEKTTQIYLGLIENSLLDAANEVIGSAISLRHIPGKRLVSFS